MYYDYLHSLRFVTDGTGALKAAYDYYPYGTPVYSLTNSDTDAGPTFASHEQDEESGNYYAKQRYYDPETGRFNRLDPMQDNLNWYAYCGGDPVNNIDPWGLEKLAGGIERYLHNVRFLTEKQRNQLNTLFHKYNLGDAMTIDEFYNIFMNAWDTTGTYDDAITLIVAKIDIIMDWAENHIDASSKGKNGFQWLCEACNDDGTTFFEYYLNQDLSVLKTISEKFDKDNIKIYVRNSHFIANTELLIKILDICIHFHANAIVWISGFRSTAENASCGGASNSRHKYNDAVDFAIGYCDTGNFKDIHYIRADIVAAYAWSTGNFWEHELKAPGTGALHLSLNPEVDEDGDGKYDDNEKEEHKRKFWAQGNSWDSWVAIWQNEFPGVDFYYTNVWDNWFTNGGDVNFSGLWNVGYILFGYFHQLYTFKK